MRSPNETYQALIDSGDIVYDPEQDLVIKKLNDLYVELCDRHLSNRGVLHNIFNFIGGNDTRTIKGLYLWGGVGRGKTFLVDIFYDAIPFPEKLRLHFHRFMRKVHHLLNEHKGVADPLEKVAKHFASECHVLCFDEFYVKDITDAMILGRLLEKLLANGITLIATSNVPPADLYRGGLQRAQFLPAIALLEKYTEVYQIDSDTDYRMRSLEKIEIFLVPANASTQAQLEESFTELAPEVGKRHEPVEIEGRLIQTLRVADDVVWFDFYALCDGPRSSNDYIELAQEYHTVLVSGIPQLTATEDDLTRRFIAFIDEMYDHAVKVIMTAAVEPQELYTGTQLKFEFDRTISRLTEMRTAEYLALPHKP